MTDQPSNVVQFDARLTAPQVIARLAHYTSGGSPPDATLITYDLAWLGVTQDISLGQLQRMIAAGYRMIKQMQEDK